MSSTTPTRRRIVLGVTLLLATLVPACSGAQVRRTTTTTGPGPASSTTTSSPTSTALAGMPPVPDPANVYSETVSGKSSAAPTGAKRYAYVPDNDDGQVWVYDQDTYALVGRYTVGQYLNHVVPNHDMSVLYANATRSNQLIPFDPLTGKPGTPLEVEDPYNLYFTPDGRYGLVMAERLDRIDVYEQPTWKKVKEIPIPCRGRSGTESGGINHADWSGDGSYFIATCEFSGQLVKLDTATLTLTGPPMDLDSRSMPQDCRVGPDGRTFFVADMMDGGVHVIDGPSFTKVGFIPTGDGAHGIYPSRDTTSLYVSNRGNTGLDRPGGGTVSVVDPATRTVRATWTIPGGGSPDMGGVSADGTRLWLSGRYHNVVYVFDTATGTLVKKLPAGKGPHGLALFPQPGRYSLGHTGNYR